MYAIRRYYAVELVVLHAEAVVGLGHVGIEPLRAFEQLGGSGEVSATDRITSYNVCYTKLLRLAPKIAFGRARAIEIAPTAAISAPGPSMALEMTGLGASALLLSAPESRSGPGESATKDARG